MTVIEFRKVFLNWYQLQFAFTVSEGMLITSDGNSDFLSGQLDIYDVHLSGTVKDDSYTICDQSTNESITAHLDKSTYEWCCNKDSFIGIPMFESKLLQSIYEDIFLVHFAKVYRVCHKEEPENV